MLLLIDFNQIFLQWPYVWISISILQISFLWNCSTSRSKWYFSFFRFWPFLLLDHSAAFDIIDHNILFHRLKHWFCITSALLLLSSFFANRFQTVVASNSKSQPVLLEFGIPQGSVLGSLLYSQNTTPLHSIISIYPGIRCHFYADDTQICTSFSPKHA